MFSREGEQIINIPIDKSPTANVVFGDKDINTLFITAMGSLYGLKMKVKSVK